MTPEDRKFIEDNYIQIESIKLGFVKNMQLHILVRFEQIYRTYVQPGFILNSWCGACVADMMKRLARYWDEMIENETKFHIEENMAIVEQQSEPTPEPTPPPKKRGRPKRKP
jgi:hypothetical protein